MRGVRQTWRPRRTVAAGAVALVAALIVVASARRASPGVGRDGSEAWPIGVPQPIAVQGGTAHFVAPSGSRSARTLVIVSALARRPGAYPIAVRARPAAAPEPPRLEDDGPARPARPGPSLEMPSTPPPASPPPAERTFHLPVRDGDPSSPSNYVAVRARLRAHSPSVQVYLDPADLDRVDEATVRDVVETFDRRILPTARRRIGVADDVDRDGRFAVLLSGWLGHLADGRLSVDGYVRGADFEPAQAPPLGNRADVMYLNAAMRSGPYLRTVMAHEYTHAVTYCRKALGPAGADEEGWLDEAIAHLAEDLHGFSRANLDYRVDAFLDAPERYRLLVEDFSAAETIRSHGHRGGSYLFLRWCADRFGPDLIGRLVRSDLRGVANLEGATGSRFEALYRGWTVGLALDAIRPDSPPDAVPPRMSYVSPDGRADRAVLDATTSHFAIVEGTTSAGVAVEVSGPPEARLQVTAIPLPHDLPRIEVAAGVERDASGRAGLVARIRERDGQAVRIESVRWLGADGRGGSIEGDALRETLGREALSGRDHITTRPLPPGAAGTVTIVGRDARGRSVVGRSN